jgi:hypothetical protein
VPVTHRSRRIGNTVAGRDHDDIVFAEISYFHGCLPHGFDEAALIAHQPAPGPRLEGAPLALQALIDLPLGCQPILEFVPRREAASLGDAVRHCGDRGVPILDEMPKIARTRKFVNVERGLSVTIAWNHVGLPATSLLMAGIMAAARHARYTGSP